MIFAVPEKDGNQYVIPLQNQLKDYYAKQKQKNSDVRGIMNILIK